MRLGLLSSAFGSRQPRVRAVVAYVTLPLPTSLVHRKAILLSRGRVFFFSFLPFLFKLVRPTSGLDRPPFPPLLYLKWCVEGQPPSGRDFRLQESKEPPLTQFASEVVPLWPRDTAVMQSNAREKSITDVRTTVCIESRGRHRDSWPVGISTIHTARRLM